MICRTIIQVVIGSGLLLASSASAVTDLRGADEVAQALLDARESDTPPEELAARLARGGESAIPSLFGTLVRGRFDVTVGERGNSTRPVYPGEHRVLVSAFGRLPWSKVRTFVSDVLEETPDDATRLVALELLGAHGTGRELTTLVEWSDPPEDRRVVALAVREGFAEALGKILDRETVSSYPLSNLYRSAHLSLVPSILTCLGERPSRENIETLSEVLGLIPEADMLVLTELGQQGKNVHHPIEERAREPVRAYLFKSDPNLLVAGILAVEQLEDVGAVPELTNLLDHADRNVRDRSLLALKSITGQQLGRDPEDWREWHASARTWWSRKAPELMGQVLDLRTTVASRAVLELSKHRYFRHELADPVARGLQHSKIEVVVLTCATLGHLGSPLSVPPLLEQLEHSNPEIQRAALLALRRITGADHGEEPQGWHDAGW